MLFHMTIATKLAIVSTLFSLGAFYLGFRAFLDSRWDRFLVSVEGRAMALVGESDYSAIFLTVEITNVGRIPVTITELNWTISEKESLGKNENGNDIDPSKWFGSSFYWDAELPMIVQPNSSHIFKYLLDGERAEPNLFARAEATFIYRPSSPKKVTHSSTRKHVYTELKQYPENKPYLPPDFETQ